ncbi:MAG: DNA translocase FtsK [Oscillospiraceae bacterium]|nr:DNA translocase FtsK [Oscillospiraceae bacterium]
MVAYLLMHYRNTPLTGRIVALLLIPVLFGAMAQLLFSMTDLGAAGGLASIISILFNDGRQLAYGGVISGLLAYGLEKIISIYGAFPVLLLAFIYFVLRSFNITISQIMEWANSKEQPVSIREKIENKRYDQFDDDEGDFLPDEETHSQANPKIIQMPHLGKGNIDIPLDDEDDDLFDYDDVESVEEPVSIPKKRRVSNPANRRPEPVSQAAKAAPSRPAASTENVKPMSVQEAEELAGVSGTEPAKTREQKPRMSREEMANETAAVAAQIEKQEQAAAEYKFPPVDLLRPSPAAIGNGREEISMTKSRLEDTIQSFGISATISDVTRGPTVTRYDFELEQGIKLSKITNLSDDIALALGVSSVRIAPIPNRISTVGIEVPNRQNSAVYLRDIIDTPKFRNAKSTLTVALGKDIGGEGILGNISKLPHLLIAGTTGSGKSVCMNSLIISLLYKSRPEELKLIMIDPKMVELGIYNGIPQLYIPVVTDPKKAAGALQWAVVEMLKRYRLFSEQGVRDLDSYNEHKKASGEDILPRVVIVIDELADLMMAASKDVEESICRVAQMGRAAGMHLIIATQRPSADVITGLMKANIPSRIAFAVSSGLESRIILDQQGAEKLVGNGDMLFSPIGTRKPVRIQGAFVSDEEREEVINFIKQEGTAEYSDEIMATIEKAAEDKNQDNGKNGGAASDADSDYDELLPQAVDVIFDTKQASVSMLQRRLKLGYARAARIVDQMEELGIVGPFEGSKPRQVLITKEQWQEMQMIHGSAPTEIMETRMNFDEEEDTFDDPMDEV